MDFNVNRASSCVHVFGKHGNLRQLAADEKFDAQTTREELPTSIENCKIEKITVSKDVFFSSTLLWSDHFSTNNSSIAFT